MRIAALALAAVLCAGCVGWSFLQRQLDQQAAARVVPQAVAPAPGTWR